MMPESVVSSFQCRATRMAEMEHLQNDAFLPCDTMLSAVYAVVVCLSVCHTPMQVEWVKIRHYRRKTRYNSKTVQDRRIVSIKVD